MCEPDTGSIPVVEAPPLDPPLTVRSQLAVLTMAASAFIFVTAEILPVGLLPQISGSLGVSEGTVGLLLTVYAALAGITAIPMTMRLSRVSRDRLLVVLMSVFTLSTLLAALAPTYSLLVAGRLICALVHGVFWAILAPTVARIVGPSGAGRSAAKVFTGTALAAVIGVPLTTALGVTFGWRVSMATVAVFGLLVTLALRALLPELPAEERHAGVPLRRILGSRRLRAVAIDHGGDHLRPVHDLHVHRSAAQAPDRPRWHRAERGPDGLRCRGRHRQPGRRALRRRAPGRRDRYVLRR